MVSMDSGMVSTDSGDGEHGSVEGTGSPGSSAEGDSLAAKRLTMRQLREILRLKLGCGLPQRAVATAVKAGKGTVSEYLGLARAAGVGWPIPEELASDEALEARVFGVKAEAKNERAAVDAPLVHAELRRQGGLLKHLAAQGQLGRSAPEQALADWRAAEPGDALLLGHRLRRRDIIG